MNLIWHLIKKDFYRLRLPLAVFSLLVAGKIVFYAYISGLFSPPGIEWLQRMQNGPEMLLRFLVEPVFAYVLVGWLVFEDSPIEQDAHWLTRPISGAQLFGAKLAGAGLMFVLWPLALNVAWWSACGVDPADVIVSAREFVVMNAALVALGLACAALTDGFPRFLLWSLVGFVVFAMAQLVFNLAGGADSGMGFTRLLVCAVSSCLAGLVIAGHQYITRRHRQSLLLVGAGVLVVGVTCAAWRWNFMGAARQSSPENPAYSDLSLKLTGPAREEWMAGQQNVRLPVQIEGVPASAAVARWTVAGDWSFAGTRVWTSRAGTSEPSLYSLWYEAIRRQLGLPAPSAPDGRVTVSLPFPAHLAQRASCEPAGFYASVDLELRQGEILAELPLSRGATSGRSRRGYGVSYLFSGPMPENRRKKTALPEPASPSNGVSLILTERSARGLWANSSPRLVATHYALVNRRTGEFFLNDQVRSGPQAISILNQAEVACWRLTFPLGPAPIRLDEMSLVVMRFGRGESVRRELKAGAMPFDSVLQASKPTDVVATSGIARMDALLGFYAKENHFMGSVLVAKGDAVIFDRSAGWSDAGQGTANTPATRFRIGSLTKQFTAAAILLLEEDGQLKVDDPLARFVPDVPEAWRAITLRQLLTHTSGIPNFTDLPRFREWRLKPRTPAETMASIRDRPLDFTPGEQFKYSNTGYVLLGWVVELASGRSYDAFLRERIFGPLGMKDTGCDTNTPPRPPHAAGYMPTAAGPAPAFLTEMQGPGGAGALYSTTSDLLRWTRGLFGGKVLSAASLEKMTTPGKSGYAFGLGVSTADERKAFSHSGAIDGFISALSYYPEEKMTVVVLANISGAPVAELGHQLAEVTFGKTVVLPSERKEVTVPVETLRRYAGLYQLNPQVTNTVRLVDGRLTTQLSGQRAFLLFPEAEKKFFLKDVDAQVEFVTSEQGQVTHLLQSQGGRTQTAPRIGEVPAERKAITVSPDILAAYPGTYELRPDFNLVITLEGGQLMIVAPGQEKSSLLAETETKFFSPVVDAQVEFSCDSQGAVTHLVVHTGGRNQLAPRKL